MSVRCLRPAHHSSRVLLLDTNVCVLRRGFSHSFIAYRHHAETEGQLHTAPCCHFTFHAGFNITVCNLLLSVPTIRRNPYSRQGRRYKLQGLVNLEGGWKSGYVARVVILAVPPMLWEPKNCFSRALPTVSVPGYLRRILSVCTYRYKLTVSHRHLIYSS